MIFRRAPSAVPILSILVVVLLKNREVQQANDDLVELPARSQEEPSLDGTAGHLDEAPAGWDESDGAAHIQVDAKSAFDLARTDGNFRFAVGRRPGKEPGTSQRYVPEKSLAPPEWRRGTWLDQLAGTFCSSTFCSTSATQMCRVGSKRWLADGIRVQSATC